MLCNKCKNRIVMHAFSEGTCEICNDKVITSHMPCNKLCKDCAENHGKCVSCGIDLTSKDK